MSAEKLASPKRPCKLTPAKKRQVVELVRRGYTMATAAETVGVSKPAISWHRARDAEFKLALDEAYEEAVPHVRRSILDVMRDRALAGERDSVRAAAVYLAHTARTLQVLGRSRIEAEVSEEQIGRILTDDKAREAALYLVERLGERQHQERQAIAGDVGNVREPRTVDALPAPGLPTEDSG
jgi:hypothetical protein